MLSVGDLGTDFEIAILIVPAVELFLEVDIDLLRIEYLLDEADDIVVDIVLHAEDGCANRCCIAIHRQADTCGIHAASVSGHNDELHLVRHEVKILRYIPYEVVLSHEDVDVLDAVAISVGCRVVTVFAIILTNREQTILRTPVALLPYEARAAIRSVASGAGDDVDSGSRLNRSCGCGLLLEKT